MEIIVLESEAFFKLVEEVISRVEATRFKEFAGKSDAEKEWLSRKEAQSLLPYKSKTKWQELRDGGKITFSQFGRKILYNRSSILEFIKKNKISQ